MEFNTIIKSEEVRVPENAGMNQQFTWTIPHNTVNADSFTKGREFQVTHYLEGKRNATLVINIFFLFYGVSDDLSVELGIRLRPNLKVKIPIVVLHPVFAPGSGLPKIFDSLLTTTGNIDNICNTITLFIQRWPEIM